MVKHLDHHAPGRRRAAALRFSAALLGCVWFVAAADAAAGSRIRDIARVRGVRENQLVGYGLVVGLSGTGDKSGTAFTPISVSTMLENLGLTIAADEIEVKNVAAVVVTASLPPFANPGARIDVVVSSLGDARSLHGGVLVQTPLCAADGRVYAVAQGPILVGGVGVEGPGGSSETINHPTVGRIPNGALVEADAPSAFSQEGRFAIALHQPDFTTAQRVAEAIEAACGPGVARATDAALIEVTCPDAAPEALVRFVSRVENLTVQPAERARVVINERTGTIVAGGEVVIYPVAISHGNLNIRVQPMTAVSQPAPFSMGSTVVIPESEVGVDAGAGQFAVLAEGTTLSEIARALNAMGLGSRDMIAIFQAIKEAGALQAELIVL
ncbi:MAG: flagellar basal body P-ring protein FlgI [Candidatus Eisenbacteria bacterium]